MKIKLIVIISLSVHCIVFSQLKIVTTTSVFADLIKNISGDKAQVLSLVPIDELPKNYQLKDTDNASLNEADLIFLNGLAYEPFLNDFLSKKNDKKAIVTLSEGVTAIPIPTTPNAKDPHAWMSIYNVLFYIHNIKKALCNKDMANAPFYEKNYDAYRAKLVKLEDELFERFNTLPMNQRVFIDEHKGLYYFARSYNLHYITLKDSDGIEEKNGLKKIRKVIQEDSVEVVFTEGKQMDIDLSDAVRNLNSEVGTRLYAESLGNTENAPQTYMDMLRHNTDAVLNGLRKKNIDVPSPSWWEDKINKKTFALIFLIIGSIAAFLGYQKRKM